MWVLALTAQAEDTSLLNTALQDTAPPPAVRLIRSVTYATHGKEKPILADLYLPVDEQEPHPTILMVHGGAWFSGNKVHVTRHAQSAAEAGYAVVAINYRLAPRHKFPAQLNDCTQALRWIGTHADEYGFDVDRVAAYGYSAGAHLVCLLGMTQGGIELEVPVGVDNQTDLDDLPTLKAIVAGGTPSEFSWIPQESTRLAFWLGGSRQALPNVYTQASPTTHVDPLDPPVFLFHGSSDRIVPVSSANRLAKELKANQIDSTLFVIPEAGHMTAFFHDEARQRAIRFLDQRLGRSRDLPPSVPSTQSRTTPASPRRTGDNLAEPASVPAVPTSIPATASEPRP